MVTVSLARARGQFLRRHRPHDRRRRPKADPRDVAALALDGIEIGAHEVLADDISRQVKAGLAADPTALYPQLAKRALTRWKMGARPPRTHV